MNGKKNRKKPSDQELLDTLRRLLDKKDAQFEPFQEETIKKILNKQDVLAVVPTGSGKSMCYQVPAMLLPGVTIVITPLLALMKDQVRKLKKLGLPVACLSSDFIVDREPGKIYSIKKKRYVRDTDEDWKEHAQGEDEDNNGDGELPLSARKIRDSIFFEAARADTYEKGKAPYKIIYVTPERLRTGSFVRFAQTANISMIAVDEAHCISMWGYEFRRRYLEISRLLQRMGRRPVVAAFTATATIPVRNDIVKFLGMKHWESIGGQIRARQNLRFSVHNLMRIRSKSAAVQKKNALLLQELKKHEGESGFIYCSTKIIVDDVYSMLKEAGTESVTRYYADLDSYLDPDADDPESMEKNLRDFYEGRKKIMVCTGALGMGIDKDDIRFVFHYNLPLCIENYYQEAGRGGRGRASDGQPPPECDCILFCQKSDIDICNMLTDYSIEKSGLSEAQKNRRREAAEKRLDKMLEYSGLYGEDSETLQGFMLSYFNEYDPSGGVSDSMDLFPDFGELDVLFSNRTKVAQELRKGKMSGTLEVGRREKKPADGESGREPLTVRYEVTGAALDYFDMLVFDAVCTLIGERAPTIFPRTVMGLLAGDMDIRLQPERKEAVENSIRKMMQAHILIDRRKSKSIGFEYPHQKGDKTKELSGVFLPLKKPKEKKNGFVYDTEKLPPLYEYAQILNGQFYTLPLARLRVGKCAERDGADDYHVSEDEFMERRIRIYRFIPAVYIPPTHENLGRPENPRLPAQFQTSTENLEILHYLLHRIDTMSDRYRSKGTRRAATGNIIRFDTMIKTLRPDMPEKKEQEYYIRRKADSLWKWTVMILEHLQATGTIAGYELMVKYPHKK